MTSIILCFTLDWLLTGLTDCRKHRWSIETIFTISSASVSSVLLDHGVDGPDSAVVPLTLHCLAGISDLINREATWECYIFPRIRDGGGYVWCNKVSSPFFNVSLIWQCIFFQFCFKYTRCMTPVVETCEIVSEQCSTCQCLPEVSLRLFGGGGVSPRVTNIWLTGNWYLRTKPYSLLY